MPKITKEELLKVAQLSQLTIAEHEIELLCKQIEDVLTYAERVKDIAKNIDIDERENRNQNVFREDVADPYPSEKILALAPERQDNYFVVPKIIETK